MMRQRESLLALKQRYAESDQRFQGENVRLTEEYRRVTVGPGRHRHVC
jgi:hypothetical protein